VKGVLRNLYIGLEAETAKALIQHPLVETNMAIVFPSDKELLKELYRHLSDLSARSLFTFFFILPDGFRTKDDVAEAGRFFFLPNYFCPEGNRPLLLFRQQSPEDSVELFTQWCSDQGFDEPVVWGADHFPSVRGEADPLLWVTNEQRDRYFESVMSRHDVLKWIMYPAVIEVPGLKEAVELQEKLEALRHFLEKESPDIRAVLGTIQKLEEERRSDKAQLRFLQQEVNNLRVFNEELRSSKETMHILNFYHTQYEVLPLWYKRFGHVIKILMGKRKLSFTFNRGAR
jgi:hypothetical protein